MNYSWQLFTLLSIVIGMRGIPQSLCAQESREVTNNTHFWTSINTTMRASDHWGAVADIHIRRTNFMSDPSFYFARVGGAYFLDTRFSVAAGYAHLWLAQETDAGRKFSNENRIYQQALWRARIERTTFLQRVRTEQRWQEVLSPESGEVVDCVVLVNEREEI